MYMQIHTFEIVHRKSKNYANVDCLSRPMSETAMLIVEGEQDDSTERNLDPYEDGALLHYILYKKHKAGTSAKVVKRVLRDAQKYNYDGKTICLKRGKVDLKIPEKEDRNDIIINAHLLGHFQAQSTYDRLKEKFYWKNMIKDIKKVIATCHTCIRHQT